MWICLWGRLAAAQAPPEPPSEAPPSDVEDDDELRDEVEALRQAVEQLQLEAMLRDAELAAARPPPPPPPPPSSASAFNPAITAIGDVFTTVGVEDGEVLPGSGPWARSLELDLRASVDPFAQAVAVVAIEQEPPLEGEPLEFGVSPEELYVNLVALPAGFTARLGSFRQSFGTTNRAHPHDYPWPDLPLPLQTFLGEEGYFDTGGLITWRVPNRVTGITLEGGAMRGSLLDPDETTAVPQWIGRAEWYHELGNVDFAVGGSGTGLGPDLVAGADAMFRYKLNSWRSVLVLAEGYSDLTDMGGFVALQVQPTRPLYLGARADVVAPADGDDVVQLGAFASYYTSEFLRLRGGVRASAGTVIADTQLTFVWGSHPVEPYWVNR